MITSDPQEFGGDWTRKKLDIFGGYLKSYRNIFDNGKAKWYRTIYVDAFAGSGACVPNGTPEDAEMADSAQAILDGSTRIALEHTPGFNEYLFIELNKKNAASLERLKDEYPHHNVRVVRGDANKALRDFCASVEWKRNRAVVFLDPFGMQVEWEVIEMLGATKGVDLWYLFPIGTMNRMLPRSGPPGPEWGDTLT
ncbi:23S rRNA (adenine(2030)-N(6))-methyltransferase RlmJ, partial [bacterium]